MLHAFWVIGAVFAGLMGGLGFAISHDPVKWTDVVTAIGTLIAAIGTVGTLAYQVVQTAKAQQQLRTQAMLQEHMEADLVQQWLHELSHMTSYLAMRLARDPELSDAGLGAWKDQLSVIHDRVKDGRSRISSRMGHQFYAVINDALSRLNMLINRTSRPSGYSSFTDVRETARELERMLEMWRNQTEEWQEDLDRRLSKKTD